MLNEVRTLFPRLLEQKINALLDEALPNSLKAFQLYKACKAEEVWQDSLEKFSEVLTNFFSRARSERRKSLLDAVLDRPLSATTFESFHLTFHNASVEETQVLKIADWAHHFMRVTYKSESLVISKSILHKTLDALTHPPLFEKGEHITFDDFCEAWKKIVFRFFGKNKDAELAKILNELRLLNTQLETNKDLTNENKFFPTIYLTQTEIDWTTAVRDAILNRTKPPRFPLSRGPQKPRLIDLQKTLRLYEIVFTSKLPEFIRHRENICATILDRCEGLLRDKAS
ncbi:MAG TPA: hypothetical protein VN132_01435 [Bdellovibrio sp.]|nr:hypothetical protein [Bdellovibrio sp.]